MALTLLAASLSVAAAAAKDKLVIGAFAYVKNAKFDATKHSATTPRYWVGRVVEIQRGGKVCTAPLLI